MGLEEVSARAVGFPLMHGDVDDNASGGTFYSEKRSPYTYEVLRTATGRGLEVGGDDREGSLPVGPTAQSAVFGLVHPLSAQ